MGKQPAISIGIESHSWMPTIIVAHKTILPAKRMPIMKHEVDKANSIALEYLMAVHLVYLSLLSILSHLLHVRL